MFEVSREARNLISAFQKHTSCSPAKETTHQKQSQRCRKKKAKIKDRNPKNQQ